MILVIMTQLITITVLVGGIIAFPADHKGLVVVGYHYMLRYLNFAKP